MVGDSRFLDAFWFDVPTCQVVLQNPDKTFFWIIEVFSTEERERLVEMKKEKERRLARI